MKPYSEDLRRRALAAVAAARARAEVVALFGVSLASLKRWLARQRAGQPLAAKRGRPGPAPRLGERELSALRATRRRSRRGFGPPRPTLARGRRGRPERLEF